MAVNSVTGSPIVSSNQDLSLDITLPVLNESFLLHDENMSSENHPPVTNEAKNEVKVRAQMYLMQSAVCKMVIDLLHLILATKPKTIIVILKII